MEGNKSTDRHTPGPWQAYRDDSREKYEIGKREHSFVTRVVAHVAFGFDEPAETEQHANARLIAAAPDLLASLDPDTLEAIADEIGPEFKHSARAASLRAVARKQREAIAKAEGRS